MLLPWPASYDSHSLLQQTSVVFSHTPVLIKCAVGSPSARSEGCYVYRTSAPDKDGRLEKEHAGGVGAGVYS